MAQVEVRDARCQEFRVDQTGAIILAGVPGDGAGGVDGSLQRPIGKIRCRGGAFASAHVHRYSQALIALVFDGFDLAHAHVDREPAARIDIRFRGVGAQFAGAGQDPVD